MAGMSILQRRLSDGTWSTETSLIRFTLVDTLYFPFKLEARIANRNNNREADYKDFQEVRIILENEPNWYIFYGKVKQAIPAWDDTYGQVLDIVALDNLDELAERIVNKEYTNHTTRSALIQSIINDHTYKADGVNNSNIRTTDTQKFETSAVTESSGKLNKDYRTLGKNALRAIYELAQADPFASPPTGYGFAYYLDANFNGNSPLPDLHYFKRGNRPSGSPSSFGLTIELNPSGGETNTKRAMLGDYSFKNEADELVTLARVQWATATGENQEEQGLIIYHGSVTNGPFVESDAFSPARKISWNAGAGTADVLHVGNGWLVISNPTPSQIVNLPGAVITQANSPDTTATVNTTSMSPPGVWREKIKREIERVYRDYNIKTKVEARKKLAEVLYQCGDSITRGEFRIVKWPYAIFTGTHSGTSSGTTLNDSGGNFVTKGVRVGDIVTNVTNGISGVITAVSETQLTVGAGGMSWDAGDAYRVRVAVRAGHTIKVINTNSSINDDMLVTKITYDEGPGILYSVIEVVGEIANNTERSQGPPESGIRDFKEKQEISLWQNINTVGGVPYAVEIVSILDSGGNPIFTVVDGDDITWVAGTATFSDGSTQSLNSGSLNMATDDVYYLYTTRGSATISVTTDFTSTVGLNNHIIALAQRDMTLGTARFVSAHTETRLTAGTILAHRLSAITANMGLLNAGEIRMGSGTYPSSFSGFSINATRIEGRQGGTIQVRIDASGANAGRFVAGAGQDLIIDDAGIQITGNYEALSFRGSVDGALLGMLWRSTAISNRIRLDAVSPYDLFLSSGTLITLQTHTAIGPDSNGAPIDLRFYENTTNGGNYVGFKAPASIAANIIWTLPENDGANGQVLTTNGSGVLSWSTGGGGGAPAGATYVTMSPNGTLTDERVLTAGTVIGIIDNGPNSTVTINHASSSTEDLHTNYLLANGNRAMTGNLIISANDPKIVLEDTSPSSFTRKFINNGTGLFVLDVSDSIVSSLEQPVVAPPSINSTSSSLGSATAFSKSDHNHGHSQISADLHNVYLLADASRNVGGTLKPSTTSTYDFGSTSLGWKTLYSVNNDTTLSSSYTVSGLFITRDNISTSGQRDSPAIRLQGKTYDTISHTSDWAMWVDPSSNSGASEMAFAGGIDGTLSSVLRLNSDRVVMFDFLDDFVGGEVEVRTIFDCDQNANGRLVIPVGTDQYAT